MFYDVLSRSPLGVVYLAAGPRGLVAVGLTTDERSFVRRVACAAGKAPVRSAAKLREPRRQMQEYLGGKRESFDLALDLRGATPFQREVLEAVRRIPRGTVLTYGTLAARLGRPNAGRAVGQALAHNPLPVLIPCHRVVSQEGELRGYLGDRIGLKARLLALEGVPMHGNCCLMGRHSGGDRQG
ncbi:MAG: methylated-DNA--[protein]-cysteine S-methyltransferase [Chloroflexi bacterium]|nr:methylated-DNA--[protein]-cysteine S-methyltransferase [Chloroflexota bacterium]